MYNMFPERRRPVIINGTIKERWVINRLYGLNNARWDNYVSKALPPNNTKAKCGDIVEAIGDKLFVTSMVKSETQTKQLRLFKINASVNIVRLSPLYENGTKTSKYSREVIAENVPAYFQDITEKMKIFDTGLLQTSTRKFIIPIIPELKLLDRIEFNDDFCQIDNINMSDNEGLYTIQTQMDKRVANG